MQGVTFRAAVTISKDANETLFSALTIISHLSHTTGRLRPARTRTERKRPWRGLLNKVDVDSLRNEGVYNLRGKQMEGQTSASKVRDRSRRGRGDGGTV